MSLGFVPEKGAILAVLWSRLPLLVIDISPGDGGDPQLGSGIVRCANEAGERLFGYGMIGSMVGLPVEQLIPQEQRPAHSEHVAQYAKVPLHRAMGRRGMGLLGLRQDGSTFPIAIELIPAVLHDTPCVICVVADMAVGLPRIRKEVEA